MTDEHGPLFDSSLQQEIELLGDLVVAASVSQGPMSEMEVDRILGVTHPSDGHSAPPPVAGQPGIEGGVESVCSGGQVSAVLDGVLGAGVLGAEQA